MVKLRIVSLCFFYFSNGLYYKPMMIVNDDSRVINKLEASLTDDTRVIIYNRHIFYSTSHRFL
jgi:hypothetical protein